MENNWLSAGGKVPKGWKLVEFKDLLMTDKSISVGVMYPGKHDDNGIPLVKVGDVTNGQVLNTPESKITKEVDHEYRRTHLSGDELLITLVGNPGDCIVVEPKMIGWNVARALAVVRLNNPALRDWLKLILLSSPSRHIIDARLNTTVQRTLNLKDIKELPILLPEDSLREKICYINNSFDKKITLNRQINQTLEQMAQTLFKSWFVDFDPVIDNALDAIANGQDIEIPESLAKRFEARKAVRESEGFEPLPADIRQLFPCEFEESELGFVPKGWGVEPLSSIANYGNNRISVSELTLENYISTENMLTEKKGISSAAKLPTVNSVPAYRGGNVLISNIRPYFKKIWIARGDGGYSNDVLGFEVKDENTEAYLFNLLYQDSFFDYMMTTSKGSKMPRGDKKAIMDLNIVIPPVTLRMFYSQKVAEFYESSHLRQLENKSLIELRDTLLPKLISGELRLDSPQGEALQQAVSAE
ncbi:restriction endonuclease subunit S [Aliivibrio wodanis]|uniref:restriction endonuclease subunit S n=1 Tax=Aliivibrio wodanis TaxID=80852 RepID=UPI00406C7714